MKALTINSQKSTAPNWTDESGSVIPYNRTTKYERSAERVTATLAKEAMRLNAGLTAFKQRIKEEALKLYEEFCKENGGKIGKGKGGASFFNFDRSIKVEVRVNEPITFDQNTIQLAKQKLDELLNDGLENAKEFVKPLVMEAFETTAGKLDTKRILGLSKHASRIKDERYAEAMALIAKAIRRSSTKEYFQVWVKDASGEYQDIQLNFSSVTVE
ncbi:MAG: DUF3164 family protein [Flavobacteriales bacterium]|nr:MAG: DUF3164 family protein [Flavobacteriales bacterium]